MKARQVLISLAGFALLSASSVASAASWCASSEIKEVNCNTNNFCFISADSYGGTRYYKIDGLNPNKNSMIALAVSAMLSKSRVKLAFVPDGLDCADIPANTLIYSVGLVEAP